MFWRFGGYANISTIDTVLDKPDVTLEEVLDESDLIQELKQHNTKLIEYLRDDTVLEKLLDYVTAPAAPEPDDEDGEEDEEEDEEKAPPKKTLSPIRSLSIGRSKEKKSQKQEDREEREKEEKSRQKYAYVSSEILSSETWSIIEALMENRVHLAKFWDFLRREPALDPVTAGYFTKINETLLDKKTEETLDFVKSLGGIIPAMLQHVDCPMVMDLLLKIISMEKAEGGVGIVDWLQTQDLMPTLLAYLGQEHPTFTQTSAGDFIKAIITISANASQNEQSCIGPNSLTRQLVSESCIEPLIADMLKGGNPLTVGVGIIIEVIRKNNSDYDPEITAGQELAPSSTDPIYLGSLLRLFAKHVPDFMDLVLSPNHTVSTGESTMSVKRKELQVAFGNSIEPLGFDRFKTCELMAELLHCSNMGLLNERGSEAYVRQRDSEREKLRADGMLQRLQEPRSAATEFSDDDSHAQDQSAHDITMKSSDEEKRQETANNAEDDGFEDVGASGDLADEMRDDFDDKNEFELESGIAETASPIKPSKSRLSLDDEFFEEPLHSPSKPTHENPPSTSAAQSEQPKAIPASPTTALASEVDELELKDEKDIAATNPTVTPSTHELITEIDAQLSPKKESQEAPPLPERDQNLNAQPSTPEGNSPSGLSPHPEDTPAPLFSPAADTSPANTSVETEENKESGNVTMPDFQQAQQTELESSIQQREAAAFVPHMENDLDGQPIVGDYLKIQFVEHKVVPTILDFFFRFPWNNFLHNVVYDVVQQVFNGPMDRGFNRNLAIDLFLTGKVTERIIEGQLKSDEAQARNNMRLGYMGHLTLIAEEVVKFSDRHPPEVLSEPVLDVVTQKLWSDYVENTLAETRERDNAILGGVRPDVNGGPRQAVLNAVNAAHGFGNNSSSVLANAGLNGGGSAGGGGLDSMDLSNNAGGGFLSGGSLLSGFGSSSDEEDEEMEEIVEHEGAAEHNSDQYPSYTPTGLSALSIFYQNNNQNPTSSTSTTTSTPDASTPSTANATPESEPPSPPQDPSASQQPQNQQNQTPSIPPPLNIPPSRARRQLAARLALKEQEKKDAVAAANSTNNTPTTATSGHASPGQPSPAQSSPAAMTPDTPAFVLGNQPHQRGMNRRSRLAGAPELAGMEEKEAWGSIENGDTAADEEGDEEEGEESDPWTKLDSASSTSAKPKSPTYNGSQAQRERKSAGAALASAFGSQKPTADDGGDEGMEDTEEDGGEGVWMSMSMSMSAPPTTTTRKTRPTPSATASSNSHPPPPPPPASSNLADIPTVNDDDDDETASEYAGGGIEDVDAEDDAEADVPIRLETRGGGLEEEDIDGVLRVGKERDKARGIWGRWSLGADADEEGNSSDEDMGVEMRVGSGR